MRLPSFAEEFAGLPGGWDHVRRTAPQWPHLEEAAALASRWEQATAGNTLVHSDARDDNLLLTADGRAYLCDWNWPVVGAAWIDTVCLLMTAFGDGVDADALLAERRADPGRRPPSDVDVLLALLCGYFLERRDQRAPQSSPYLRRHQDWCAEVVLGLAGAAPRLGLRSVTRFGRPRGAAGIVDPRVSGHRRAPRSECRLDTRTDPHRPPDERSRPAPWRTSSPRSSATDRAPLRTSATSP